METSRKEYKTVLGTNTNYEKKIFKMQEEIDQMRQKLTIAREMENEQEIFARQERLFFEEQSATMAKQRLKLLAAYKKQLLLLDNLKRQNICLKQAKLIQFSEKDFAKLLDWNGSND